MWGRSNQTDSSPSANPRLEDKTIRGVFGVQNDNKGRFLSWCKCSLASAPGNTHKFQDMPDIESLTFTFYQLRPFQPQGLCTCQGQTLLSQSYFTIYTLRTWLMSGSSQTVIFTKLRSLWSCSQLYLWASKGPGTEQALLVSCWLLRKVHTLSCGAQSLLFHEIYLHLPSHLQ